MLDFAGKSTDELLQIQAETGLSFWSKNDYLNELEREDSVFKIVQDADGKIIGFALVRLLAGDLNNCFDAAEILNIAVGKSFQKQGIGQMIFEEILRELVSKNIREIWLEVRESNVAAIAFYQKNGFEMRFERKDYYSHPMENALIFRRLIK